MRPYVVVPLLALLNMGASAATIHGFNSKNSPYSRLQDAHNRRQLHSADFSTSSPAGPAAKGAITNSGSSVSGSSPSGSGSLNARTPSIFDPRRLQPLHRRLISVLGGSNPGAESTSVVNGDLAVPPRAETGSHDADLDVDVIKRNSPSNTVVSRQDDEDASTADAVDTTAASDDTSDPVVSRQDDEDATSDATTAASDDTSDPVVSRQDDEDASTADAVDTTAASDDTSDPVVSRQDDEDATSDASVDTTAASDDTSDPVVSRQDDEDASTADAVDTTAASDDTDPDDEDASTADAVDTTAAPDDTSDPVVSRQDDEDASTAADAAAAGVDTAAADDSADSASDDSSDSVVSRQDEDASTADATAAADEPAEDSADTSDSVVSRQDDQDTDAAAPAEDSTSDDTSENTDAVVSRQDDEDPSGADDDASSGVDTAAADDDTALDDTVDSNDGDAADPVVSRDLSLEPNGLSVCQGSAALPSLLLPGKRMLRTVKPINVRAGKPRGLTLLNGFLESSSLDCNTQEFSTKVDENDGFSPRNDNLDIPTQALPPVPRNVIDSASKRSSEPQAWSLADSKVTKTRRQLESLPVPVPLPKLPAVPRDALSAPAPRNSFVVRKEDRL